MITLFLQALRVVTLPYTALFGAMVAYWIIVALGFLDIEVLDFDIDDVEVGLGGLLTILNIGEVPFAIWLTIFSFQMSVYSIIYNLLLDSISSFSFPGWLRFLSCAIIFIPLAAFVTKLMTKPLKQVFEIHSVKKSDFVGKECVITSSKVDERFGLGEIRISGVPQILDIRAKSEDGFVKNDKALIYEYDEKHKVFYVTRV